MYFPVSILIINISPATSSVAVKVISTGVELLPVVVTSIRLSYPENQKGNSNGKVKPPGLLLAPRIWVANNERNIGLLALSITTRRL